MSLVTRCPTCSTQFKVVPDQIRIAEGWVRCGQCGEVFEASAQMQLYDQRASTVVRPLQPRPALAPQADQVQQPASAVPAAIEPVRAVPIPPVAGNADAAFESADLELRANPSEPRLSLPAESDFGGAQESDDDERARQLNEWNAHIGAEAQQPEQDDDGRVRKLVGWPAAAAAAGESEQKNDERAYKLDDWAADTEADAHDNEQENEDWPFDAAFDASGKNDPSDDLAPSFAASAEWRAFWATPRMRRLLWAALALLLAGLFLQMVLGQRDWLAAHAPRLAPVVRALCAPLGCRVRPYRYPDAIVIDSSAFNRAAGNSFHLSVTLRNSADFPVASPALELTLTDAEEQTLVRRVITATELGAPAALAARGEFSAAKVLSINETARPEAIVNYRLVAFYP
jgi:predicted Zn finger-like uncharacterized protein